MTTTTDKEDIEDMIGCIHRMLESIIDNGEIPHMLVVPEFMKDSVVSEFPHLSVYTGEMRYDVECFAAPASSYRKGRLVIH